MTYFSINDTEEAIPIRDAKGKYCQFCVGANVSDEIEDDAIIFDKEKKKALKLTETMNSKATKNKTDKRERAPPGKVKKVFFWICGIENMKMDEEENMQKEPEIIDVSIDQDPFWANFCDLNAIIAIALSCFCFAFFNKFDS